VPTAGCEDLIVTVGENVGDMVGLPFGGVGLVVFPGANGLVVFPVGGTVGAVAKEEKAV
jgi:hypothetical protein